MDTHELRLGNLSFESKLPFLTSILVTSITLLAVIWKYGIFSQKSNILPPGNLGLPVIGESLSFIRAGGQDKLREWFNKRIMKHGPVFKTSLLGSKVIVITGQAGNRFIFSGGMENNGIEVKQPAPTVAIMGENSIFNLSGSRHKLVRGAIMSFLNRECIQRYVGEMDSLVKQQLFLELTGKDLVEVVPLMKKITFKVTCDLLFALQEGEEKEALFQDFTAALRGTWSVPLNFPGTTFRNALKARRRIYKLFSRLIATRKSDDVDHNDRNSDFRKDVISCLLKLRDEGGKPLSEDEIINNLIALMIASHDTGTVVLSLLIKKLATDANAYAKVLQEQSEVANEARGEKLSWKEMQKMRYTWNMAQELMRITPPIFGSFRQAWKDTYFAGYHIPKGCQILWVASTHMDEKIFEDPEKFDPTRFDTVSKSIPPYTCLAFGGGPRICPGAEFARIEVLLIIHHFITTYHWTQVLPNEPMIHNPLPSPAKGLPINIFSRKS